MLSLLLSIAIPALAQNIPNEQDDPGRQENFEVLQRRVRQNKADIYNSLNSDQTYGGAATFEKAVTVSTSIQVQGTAQFNGPTSVTGLMNLDGGATLGLPTGTSHDTPLSVYAKSVDGASQSSGCVVSVWVDATTPAGKLVFSSTSTASTTPTLGVLMEGCAPAAYCRVAYSGLVRAQGKTGGSVGMVFSLSDTRCQGNPATAGSANVEHGRLLAAEDAGKYWVLLGTR